MGVMTGFASAAILVATLAVPAAQAATPAEIGKARAECAQHKAKVKRMESQASADAEVLAKAKSDWEAACQQAEVLMNQGRGSAAPAPQASRS